MLLGGTNGSKKAFSIIQQIHQERLSLRDGKIWAVNWGVLRTLWISGYKMSDKRLLMDLVGTRCDDLHNLQKWIEQMFLSLHRKASLYNHTESSNTLTKKISKVRLQEAKIIVMREMRHHCTAPISEAWLGTSGKWYQKCLQAKTVAV